MLRFWLAPLFSVREMYRQVRALTSGETFMLARDTGTIVRNGTGVARFDDVARIQLRTIRDAEGCSEYRFAIVLRNDQKLSPTSWVLKSHERADVRDPEDVAAEVLPHPAGSCARGSGSELRQATPGSLDRLSAQRSARSGGVMPDEGVVHGLHLEVEDPLLLVPGHPNRLGVAAPGYHLHVR